MDAHAMPEPPHIMLHRMYRGMFLPNFVLDSSIDRMKDFTVRPDDVWIVTYPKSGTHWIMEIVGLVLARGVPEKINRDLSSLAEMINMSQTFPKTRQEELANPPDMTPFMDTIDKAASPRTISTHLGLDLLPSTMVKTGKVVYVARNPKDVPLSFFNFVGKSPGFNKTWEEMLQSFMEGRMAMGPWAEHVKPFWDIRNEKNVLFLFYEEMKKDPLKTARQVADLIGMALSEEELQKVVEHSSFSGMKKSYQKAQADETNKHVTKVMGNFNFMNKGVAGGWKNRFTVAQNEVMDAWIKEQLADSDIEFSYS